MKIYWAKILNTIGMVTRRLLQWHIPFQCSCASWKKSKSKSVPVTVSLRWWPGVRGKLSWTVVKTWVELQREGVVGTDYTYESADVISAVAMRRERLQGKQDAREEGGGSHDTRGFSVRVRRQWSGVSENRAAGGHWGSERKIPAGAGEQQCH